jgi:hypothetical protein
VHPQMEVGVGVQKCTRRWPQKCSCNTVETTVPPPMSLENVHENGRENVGVESAETHKMCIRTCRS